MMDVVDDVRIDPGVEVKLLRAQVQRLLNLNLALQSQLQAISRQRTGMTIEEIVPRLQEAIGDAEAAMAQDAPEGLRYAIPELQVTPRGIFSYSNSGLIFGLPAPEETVPAAQRGSVQLTLSKVPLGSKLPQQGKAF